MAAPKCNLLFWMTGADHLCGGIASANLNVLHALTELSQEKGVGLTVFSLLEKQGDRPDFLPGWVQFRGFHGNRLRFVASLLTAARGDSILCFDHVRLALPVLPLAAAGAVKTVIFAHGSEAWKYLRKTSRWSFRHASLCLTNSHFTLAKMREEISRFNGRACLLGLSPKFHLNRALPGPPFGSAELTAVDGRSRLLGDRVLLLVGRMNTIEGQKGHEALINLLPELQKHFEAVQLVFPGPGDGLRGLQELALRKGVASSVFLPGLVSVETLEVLYHQCYALVMPSEQEGFGLVYLEAMNYGKPCVGCFDQGAEDIIVHGVTGLLVQDAQDQQELFEVICALLRDPERAKRLGKQGFERLHGHFTACHAQARIKEAIAGVL